MVKGRKANGKYKSYNKIFYQYKSFKNDCLTSSAESAGPLTCIQDQGYKVDELLENASETRWRPEYLSHKDGWFFTENQTRLMTTSTDNNNVFLLKNSSQYCQVYLHDWDYFVRNVNPATIPSIQLELNEDFAFKLVYLKVKKMELTTNCDPSPSHKMSGCVRDHVTRVTMIN